MGPFLMLPTARIVVALCGIVLMSTGCFGIPVENDADDATFPGDLNDVGQAQHEPDADDEPEENNVADDSHGPGDSHNDPILSMFAQSDARVDAQVERGFCHGGIRTHCARWGHGNWIGWVGGRHPKTGKPMTGTEWYQVQCDKELPGSKFTGKVLDCGRACWACKKLAGCCMPQPVKYCGRPHDNKGFWTFVAYTNGKRRIEYTSGRSSTDSHARTKSWETSVTVSIENNFVFKGIKGTASVGTQHSRGVTRQLSSALEKSKSHSLKVSFDKPGAVWQWTFQTKDQC